MMTLPERAAAYVARMDSAISGQGGHDSTFKVAVALVHGFALSDAQAWPILCEFNQRCDPPWSESDLRHKLEDAGRLTRHPQPRGHLSGITHRHAVGISRPQPWVVKLGTLVEPGSFSPPCEEEKISPPHPTKSPPMDISHADKSNPSPEVPEAKPSVPQQPAPAPPGSVDEGEAKRIAGELVKLHRDGAFTSPDDPRFYAQLLRTFGGTYEGMSDQNL